MHSPEARVPQHFRSIERLDATYSLYKTGLHTGTTVPRLLACIVHSSQVLTKYLWVATRCGYHWRKRRPYVFTDRARTVSIKRKLVSIVCWFDDIEPTYSVPETFSRRSACNCRHNVWCFDLVAFNIPPLLLDNKSEFLFTIKDSRPGCRIPGHRAARDSRPLYRCCWPSEQSPCGCVCSEGRCSEWRGPGVALFWEALTGAGWLLQNPLVECRYT